MAESTGKHGKGALPVVDEPLGRPDEYGQDRAFVAISTERDAPDTDSAGGARSRRPSGAAALDAARRAGRRVLPLGVRDGSGRRGVAASIRSTSRTSRRRRRRPGRCSPVYARDGSLEEPAPSRPTRTSRSRRARSPAPRRRTSSARRFDSLGPGDYVAFLSYLPADARRRARGRRCGARGDSRRRTRAASTYGVGRATFIRPVNTTRGGPNTPLAFVITADDATATPIPESGYSFAVLKRAQALGDFETLEAHGRRSSEFISERRDGQLDDVGTASGLDRRSADCVRAKSPDATLPGRELQLPPRQPDVASIVPDACLDVPVQAVPVRIHRDDRREVLDLAGATSLRACRTPSATRRRRARCMRA